ncbi:MAG: DUF488 family protein [Bacteriovoracaceae bacterium]
MARKKTLFTIGHSTHTTREFVRMLKANDIELLVDVRHYPGSRYCPQFGKSRLRRNLRRNRIEYVHMVTLGGRRRPDKNSHDNDAWRSPQFRGYADYMQTEDFRKAMNELFKLARGKRTAIMCSEAVPWRCHRSLVSDSAIAHGWTVLDIFTEKKTTEHSPTPFAHFDHGEVTYPPA